jgi:hypothetical protein
MLADWSFDGPLAGVGGKARVRANLPGEQRMETEVLESVSPNRTVEETVGADGVRRTRSTYTLGVLPSGATHAQFQLEYLEAPGSERLARPLIRAHMERANATAMRRLGEALARAEPHVGASRAA